MRLLLLTIDFPPQTGGVARYLDALAGVFRDEITVVAHTSTDPTAPAFDAQAGYPIVRERLLDPSRRPAWLPMIHAFRQRKEAYDIAIVSHVLPAGTAALIVSWFTRKPYVVIVHGLDIVLARKHALKQFVAKAVLRRAKCVVTNSAALEREVRKEFGVTRTVVVYPVLSPIFPEQRSDGVGPQSKGSRPSTPVERGGASSGSNTTRNDGVFRLLTVARLVERKGHLRVLEAIARLRQEGVTHLRYEIIGNGPILSTIQEAVRAQGLGDVVTITTDASDEAVAEAYARADVFVMPTVASTEDREGFGTVYLEAAAYSVPSIATQLPGVDEAVLDKQTGLLVPDGDITALADSIRRLASDSDLRARLGQAAQDRALLEFTAEVQFAKLRNTLL